MNPLFAQFHFLRPLWLLAIVPALVLAFALWRRKSSAANWRAAIAPELIDHLLESVRQLRPQWPWLLFAGWLIAAFALAGPTWEKLPQPVLQKRDGLVIVLDLSLSMYAEDIKPSRLQRARFKIIDILQQRHEGLTGLVVYSGDSHVVSPLTDDTATIANLVPALAPAIMPSFGSNVMTGIDTALQLLHNAGFEQGRILLISDEISDEDIDKIATKIDGKKWQLAVIGVGTEQGAPIPLPRNENQGRDAGQGGFIKQNDGTIAIAQLHRERFSQLTAKVNGRYENIRVDDSDIEQVLPSVATTNETVRTVEREFDQWHERGPQFIILLLPLAAFAFRRGWLLILMLMPFSMPSQALEWRDLWLRPDQQAQQDFNAGNSKAASEKFQDPSWRGAAQYRSGDFENAAQSLQTVDSADAQYNRGNALAHSGKLQEAIDAYDAALKKNPANDDAKANRDLVEKLLKQQQQKQSDSSSQQNKQDDKQQDNKQQNNQSQQDQSQQGQSQSDQSHNSPQNNQPQKSEKDSQQNEAKNSQQQNSHDQQQNGEQPEKPADQKNQQNTSEQQTSAQQSAQRQEKQQDKPEQDDATQQAAADKLTPEKLTPEQQKQQRATEQWLRQIPDDPSGLLRRKFLYENRQREQQAPNDGKPVW
jgi:Ca-activated chloride channel homolog